MKISKRANKIQTSKTMNATLKARDLINQGREVILASVGEPHIDVDQKIKNELIERLNSGPSRYGDSQGVLKVRESLVTWFKDLYGEAISPQNIIITPGSKFALFALMQILCEEGDEVIIPAPYWVSYESLVELASGIPKIVDCNDSNYKLTREKLRKSLNQKSRLLILNSPNNPTGAIYSFEELESLYLELKNFPEVDVLCDDIYNQIIQSNNLRAPHFFDVAEKYQDNEFKKRLIIVHGASKSFSMTGWRIGWIIARSEYITKLNQMSSQILTNIPDFIQFGLYEALAHADEYMLPLKKLMQERFSAVSSLLKECSKIKVYPSEGAFYLWIRLLDNSKNADEVADDLLQKYHLASVSGDSFGSPLHLRFSLTLPDAQFNQMLLILKNYFN